MAKNGKQVVPHSPEAEMTFLEHLEALRWHLIRSVAAIALFGIVIFVNKEFVFDRVIFGPKYGDFPTYEFFCSFLDNMCNPPAFDVQTISVEEKFLTHLKVSIILGIVIAFPYVFWELWNFVKPGLYPKERKAARGVVWVCSSLFLLGIAFGYFIITPFALNFLTGYDVADTVSSPTLSSYVSSITFYTLPAGFVFELPIVVYFLTKVGLITPAFMKQYRRIAFVLILVLSAIITPPDVFTQFLIGVPVFILYEISILISEKVYNKLEQESAT